MKSIIAILCVLAVASAASPANVNFNRDNFIQVVEGVLDGIGIAEKWTDVAPCISSSEDAVTHIIAAVKLLKKEDPIDVAEGLAALGKALEDLPTALQSCGGVVLDIEKLAKALKAITSPTSFIFNVAKNLLVNGVDIYKEVYTAVGDYDNSQWEDFGVQVGEALAQVFLYGTVHSENKFGANGNSTLGHVLLFLKGVVEGISTNVNFDEIAPCLNDATIIAKDIDAAINDFVAQDTESVIAGVKLVGQALEALPNTFAECKVAYSELPALVNAIEQLSHPLSLAYKISKSLIVNGKEIWSEVTSAIVDYRNGDFESTGKDIGTILINFISPNQKKLGARFAEFVNERASFQVETNGKFANWTVGQMKQMLGTKIINLGLSGIANVTTDVKSSDLPQNFSAYEQWPECKHAILDQAQCGSCWAFSAAETLSDRFCIASNGSIKVQLSPQYLVSCSYINMGCNGGFLTMAWRSLEHSGLPTLECTPYVSGTGDVPSCSKEDSVCADNTTFKTYNAKSLSTRWYMSPNSIKAEILANGPVQTAFTVYEDFMNYKSGVYKYTTGSQLGGHAVKIVGWGNEDGQDYWLIANSWGTSWGLDGFFKIGIDECGIGGNGVAGKADVEAALKSHRNFF